VIDSDKARDRVSLNLVQKGERQVQVQVLQLAEMYTATVVKVGEEGSEVNVTHDGQQVPALIHMHHLTDQVSLSTMIASNLTLGQELECMTWPKQGYDDHPHHEEEHT
jgi:acetolactate synthase small subunit